MTTQEESSLPIQQFPDLVLAEATKLTKKRSTKKKSMGGKAAHPTMTKCSYFQKHGCCNLGLHCTSSHHAVNYDKNDHKWVNVSPIIHDAWQVLLLSESFACPHCPIVKHVRTAFYQLRDGIVDGTLSYGLRCHALHEIQLRSIAVLLKQRQFFQQLTEENCTCFVLELSQKDAVLQSITELINEMHAFAHRLSIEELAAHSSSADLVCSRGGGGSSSTYSELETALQAYTVRIDQKVHRDVTKTATIVRSLTSLLKNCIPGYIPEIRPFGSCTTSLPSESSDLDLSLSFYHAEAAISPLLSFTTAPTPQQQHQQHHHQQPQQPQQQQAPEKKQERRLVLIEQTQVRMPRMRRRKKNQPQQQPVAPIEVPVTIPGAVHVRDILKSLTKHLRRNIRGGFEVKEVIYGARIPLIKLEHRPSGTNVDVCIDNRLALKNSNLLYRLAQVDKRGRTVMLAVKLWASRRGCNSARNGTISSYAWILMCIYFLQHGGKQGVRPILPEFRIITSARQQPAVSNSNNISSSSSSSSSTNESTTQEPGAGPASSDNSFEFELLPLRTDLPPNTQNAAQLLRDFFEYYATDTGFATFSFSFYRDIVSIRHTQPFQGVCLRKLAAAQGTVSIASAAEAHSTTGYKPSKTYAGAAPALIWHVFADRWEERCRNNEHPLSEQEIDSLCSLMEIITDSTNTCGTPTSANKEEAATTAVITGVSASDVAIEENGPVSSVSVKNTVPVLDERHTAAADTDMTSEHGGDDDDNEETAGDDAEENDEVDADDDDEEEEEEGTGPGAAKLGDIFLFTSPSCINPAVSKSVVTEPWRLVIEDPFAVHDLGVCVQTVDGQVQILDELRRALQIIRGGISTGTGTSTSISSTITSASTVGVGRRRAENDAVDTARAAAVWESLTEATAAAAKTEAASASSPSPQKQKIQHSLFSSPNNVGVCFSFQKGECNRGSSCHFSHDLSAFSGASSVTQHTRGGPQSQVTTGSSPVGPFSAVKARNLAFDQEAKSTASRGRGRERGRGSTAAAAATAVVGTVASATTDHSIASGDGKKDISKAQRERVQQQQQRKRDEGPASKSVVHRLPRPPSLRTPPSAGENAGDSSGAAQVFVHRLPIPPSLRTPPPSAGENAGDSSGAAQVCSAESSSKTDNNNNKSNAGRRRSGRGGGAERGGRKQGRDGGGDGDGGGGGGGRKGDSNNDLRSGKSTSVAAAGGAGGEGGGGGGAKQQVVNPNK